MKYSKLGNSGIELPQLTFGTSFLGNLYREIAREEKSAIIQEWLAQLTGNILVDTAGKYGAGLSLEILGEEIELLENEGDRIYISNKLGWRRCSAANRALSFEPEVWVNLKHDATQDISYQGMYRCWEEGCELLKGKKPAFVSVHDPDEYLANAENTHDKARRWEDILGAYQALFEMKERGDALGVGIGSKDWVVAKELSNHFDLDWVMLANSLTVLHHPPELLDFVSQLNRSKTAIINSALFHGGFLVGGSFFDYAPLKKGSQRHTWLHHWRSQFNDICHKFDQLPAHVATQYGLAFQGVHSVALNSTKSDRVLENIQFVTDSIPADLWNQLSQEGLIQYNPFK